VVYIRARTAALVLSYSSWLIRPASSISLICFSFLIGSSCCCGAGVVVWYAFSSTILRISLKTPDLSALNVTVFSSVPASHDPPRLSIPPGDVAVQPIEDAGVVAADEEDFVALQFQVAVQSAGQQLHGGDEDAEGFGEQGDGGEEFDFHA